MTAPSFASVLRHQGRHFAADQRAVSAVEFALLLPLMLSMYFGTLEVSDAISADRQVTLVANTVAEVATQYTSVSSTDLSNILGAASAVMAPFPVTNLKVTLSSVTIDSKGNATVAWSTTLNGSVRCGNVTSLVPLSFRIPSTSLLWGEATYKYKPVIGYVVTGTLSMYNDVFSAPRLTTSVAGPAPTC